MIKIKRYSGVTVLETEQKINASPEKVWDFFSSPHNLPRITPPEMNFIITGTDFDKKAYPGQIITYTLTPFRGFRTSWVTEITQVAELKYFIDEQRIGPYRFWHHRHLFEKDERGTVMKDIVTFKVPGGYPGSLIGKLVVVPRVEHIFRYRAGKIEELFS